ncbi:MAG TPA: phosphopentomutase [Firmicutes bacterium]|nr:phosphopentomutase [Bacillota bacterium]
MTKGRLFLVVLDGVGIGELPDAHRYGDAGSNTLGNIAAQLGGLSVPFLISLGLGNIVPLPGVPAAKKPRGAYGKMAEASPGKDTITGHWELAGVILERPFPVYPNGFPEEVIREFTAAIGRPVLGNKAASGTEILKELGPEHMATGKPIVYTSADSVFQIAAHEEIIPIDELYRFCISARSILRGEHQVARVIARPFVGEPGAFVRTKRRKDFSVVPPAETILDRLAATGIAVVGVGKIEDIFSGRGLTASYHTGDNISTLEQLLTLGNTLAGPALAFANCVDFDSLYGHRNDVRGFAAALATADEYLAKLATLLHPEDLLMITADHGGDPTTPSTDHSREYVPLLVTGAQVRAGFALGIRNSFTDIAATIADYFGLAPWPTGKSFYQEMVTAAEK